jgi:hypothetical protein
MRTENAMIVGTLSSLVEDDYQEVSDESISFPSSYMCKPLRSMAILSGCFGGDV